LPLDSRDTGVRRFSSQSAAAKLVRTRFHPPTRSKHRIQGKAEMLHSLEMLQASAPCAPKIGPHSRNAELKIYTGTCGGTALSMQRRAHDSRFATRYFVGHGLDVGGGHDSLALYVELFPLIRHVVIYDAPQGDAQKLANVDDASFDFLFSSHCLEHVRDATEALTNWIRVIKPGGHLVISVPDEDLYEQGVWPSTFNSDHKLTFTLSKKTSWSPVSINLFSLLSQFSDKVKPLSIITTDHAYRYQFPRFDQTQMPLSECAIEFVLKKL
jgi:SAM-dependent methyltransferase